MTFITVDPQIAANYALVDTDGPSRRIWPVELFVTTDTQIPSNWTGSLNADGFLVLGPEAWHEPAFWGSEYSETPQTPEQRLEVGASIVATWTSASARADERLRVQPFPR